ncbi:hypothetical protein VTO58DRAFT_107073 [Aureobasidium pullulans]
MCSHTNSSIFSSNTPTLYASGLTCDYCHGPAQYNPMARRWYCLRCRRFIQDCLAQRDKEVKLCFERKSKAAHSDAPARFVN